jgi:hypothetical protein
MVVKGGNQSGSVKMLAGHLYAKAGWSGAVRRGSGATGLRQHRGRRRS